MGIVQRVHFSFQICAIMFLKWNNRRSHLLLDIDITKNKEVKNKIKNIYILTKALRDKDLLAPFFFRNFKQNVKQERNDI